MNVSIAPSSIALSQARPITVAVLAMGGQGGGVLVDWIVAARNTSNTEKGPNGPSPGASHRDAHHPLVGLIS